MTDPFADMEPHDDKAFVLNLLEANEAMGSEIVRLRAKLAAVREVHTLMPHHDPHMDDWMTCSCCGLGIGTCATRRAIDD